MSVVYCDNHGYIDTDFNAEHFVYGTETCVADCDHENTEHYGDSDLHPGSRPYTVCLGCGMEINNEEDF